MYPWPGEVLQPERQDAPCREHASPSILINDPITCIWSTSGVESLYILFLWFMLHIYSCHINSLSLSLPPSLSPQKGHGKEAGKEAGPELELILHFLKLP